MRPIPAGALEWLQRQYAGCGDLEVRVTETLGTRTHWITELRVTIAVPSFGALIDAVLSLIRR